MNKKIIINADDFGQCKGVNDAIAQAHQNGILTSTTLMANMPSAVNALKISKQLPTLGVGIHLNILQCKPVSQSAAVKILLDTDGNFKYSAGKLALLVMLNKKYLNAVETEFDAQIAKMAKLGFDKPTHIDSHKHFHCLPAVWKIVCRLAEKYDIKAIRWPYEPATVCSSDWPKVKPKDRRRAFIVRTMAEKCRKINSQFIKTDLFFGLAHTGKIDDNFYNELCRTQFAGTAELMTHPGYTEGLSHTRLIEERLVELKWLCDNEIKEKIAASGIELTHYGK